MTDNPTPRPSRWGVSAFPAAWGLGREAPLSFFTVSPRLIASAVLTKSSIADSTFRMPIFTFLAFMGSLLISRDIGLKIPDKPPHTPKNICRLDIPEMPMISPPLPVIVADDPFSFHDIDERVLHPMRHVERYRHAPDLHLDRISRLVRDLLVQHELGRHVGMLCQHKDNVKLAETVPGNLGERRLPGKGNEKARE